MPPNNVKHRPVSGESHHVGVLDIFSRTAAAGFVRLEHLSLQEETKIVDQNSLLFNASKTGDWFHHVNLECV